MKNPIFESIETIREHTTEFDNEIFEIIMRGLEKAVEAAINEVAKDRGKAKNEVKKELAGELVNSCFRLYSATRDYEDSVLQNKFALLDEESAWKLFNDQLEHLLGIRDKLIGAEGGNKDE